MKHLTFIILIISLVFITGACTKTGYLHTEGSTIVDAHVEEVILR